MKVRSFIKFLLDHFSEDDDIEVNHCCDGGAFITDQIGSDDTLICLSVSDDEDHFYNGDWIDKKYEMEDINKS